MGEPERRLLLDIGHPHAPLAAVAHRITDLLVGVADHDADLADSGGGQGLDAVEENGLVGDRDELLGGGVGDGAEARSTTSGED